MKLVKRNFWVEAANMKKLVAFAAKRGFKTAHLVRIAIAEYLERNK